MQGLAHAVLNVVDRISRSGLLEKGLERAWLAARRMGGVRFDQRSMGHRGAWRIRLLLLHLLRTPPVGNR